MDSNKIKVFVVDDHDLFREGVNLLINGSSKAEVVGEAVNGEDFLEKLDGQHVDIVLMDIAMPIMDGIEASKKAHEKYPDLKIIALTMFGEEKYYFKMLQSGSKGFVLKSSGISELLNAIVDVHNNKSYFSNELLMSLVEGFKAQLNKDSKVAVNNMQHLSAREVEVLKCIASGLSNEDIAEKLNISTTTIRTHRARVMAKTGCNNTASLIFYAIKNNFVKVPQ